MPMHIKNDEDGLCLSALHSLPDHLTPLERTVYYILEHLLKKRTKDLFEHYKLKTYTTEKDEVIEQIARRRGYLLKENHIDCNRVHRIILHDFRKGKLGSLSFSCPPK